MILFIAPSFDKNLFFVYTTMKFLRFHLSVVLCSLLQHYSVSW